MSRRKTCNIVRVRAADPVWNADRYNDKLVFKAIERRRRCGLSISRSIRALFASVEWRDRMSGKKPASWKRKYLKWRLLVTIGKRKKMRRDPENIAPDGDAKVLSGRHVMICREIPAIPSVVKTKGKLSTCAKRKRGK